MPKFPINRPLATLLAIAVTISFRVGAQEGQDLAVPKAQAKGFGAAAKAKAPEPPTEAEHFLDAAILKVGALKSVSAKLTEKVEMLGQKFTIQGVYLKAPNDRLRLELDVKDLPDSAGTMLQVCDGRTFWDYQRVFETQIFRRLDAAPILAKIRTTDIGDELRQQILTQMGFAGPDVLLVGLRKTIKFDQKEPGTLDGRSVWILRGNWQSREGLLGPNSQPLPRMANLPSYIPSLVTVYLGAEDLWPYKVTLVGQRPSVLFEDTRPVGPDGRKIGSKGLIQKPLLSRIEMVYTDVKLDQPVPDKEFVFNAPPGAQVEDETKKILDVLEQAAAQRSAQKKTESAKEGGEAPILDQSIDVPKDAPANDTPPPVGPR